jgi:Arc/MetJ-type ribon-helix-helix transcriptional regulator
MSVSVSVDEELLRTALRSGEEASESEVVEAALRLLVQLRSQRAAAELWGKVAWEGDLEESRLGHV